MKWSVAAAAVCAAWVVGCSSNAGPQRHRVSGTVTLDGKPIPYGEVLFTPDAGKKNAGPQGVANIADGTFDTRTAGGRGTGSGAMIVRVNGMTKPGGKTLCEYEFRLTLPAEDSTQTIDVPKKAANNANAPEI